MNRAGSWARRWWATSAAVLALACSDDPSGQGAGGAGGAGGEGGGAGVPVPQGAVSFKLSSQPGGPACPEGSSPPRVSIGAVAENTATPVMDKVAGTVVLCKVSESGGLYSISARIQDAQGNSFSFQTVEPGAAPALKVAATLSSPSRINSLASTEDCALDVATATDGSNSFGLAPGRVWGTISCPSLGLLTSPADAPKCALGVPDGERSYVLFENCDEE